MNPIIKTVFAADASAHVWENDPDTMWLYTSHDEPGANTHDGMQSYHVFSTKNMVDWTDHGRVFHLSQASWAVSHMWAVDAVYRHGKYYLIYCAVERATSQFRTGIAVSDMPQGPFDDLGFIKGIDWGQDPALFVDDDNTPYLFWGCGGHCYGCKLTDDESVYEGKTTLLLDAAVVDKTGGLFMGTRSANSVSGYTGHGYAEGFGKRYFGIDFLAISGIERTAKLKLRYRASSDVKIYLMVNNIMVFPYGVDYEEHDKKFHVLPQCGEWQEIYLPDITLKAGDNHIRLYNSDTDLQLDCICIEER